jgi:predicted kinase
MQTLLLFRGLPGAGKTTLAESLQKCTFCSICSADDYMINSNGDYEFNPGNLKSAHEQCRNKAIALIDRGDPLVIVANTFASRWEYQPYLDLAKSRCNLLVYSIIVENWHNSTNVHGVPDERLTEMKSKFEIQL